MAKRSLKNVRVACVGAGRQPLSNLADAAQAMELVGRIYAAKLEA